MATITRIEIDGFKAFPENFVLDLEGGKNLLLYGENGSGKSSIYYALHAVFQSVLKDDRGAKYFKPEDEQHLININKIEDVKNNAYHPFIRITFNNNDIWRLDHGGLISENGGSDDTIKLLNRGSAFINHSYISRFHAARNSEDINLWNVFYKDILPFYRAKENEDFLSVQFDNIQDEANTLPRLNNQSFLSRITEFNNKLFYFIEDTNKRIGNIYNENFKFEKDPDLEIKLIYKADNAPDNPTHDPYYLFYGNNRNGVKCPKLLVSPRIGIEIKENGKEIHKPQTYFNEARLTAIALAVRFASLSKKSDGCFLALDDMLISLDMSNRTKVIDYLLNISDKYKIYLFTHDRAFYNYICHKIQQYKKSKEWVYKTISYNSKNNEPIIIDEYSDYLSKAKHFYQIGDYDTSAIYLRKQLEQSVGELLPYELKANVDGGFVGLKTLWEKLLKFYSANKQNINISIQKKFTDSKLLILNPAAHFQRLSNPIYRTELKIAFEIVDYLQTLNKIDNKLVIMSGQQIIFQHPKRNYKCSFELDSDLEIIQNEHIVAKIPKCKKIRWTYDGIENWDFDKNTQNNNHPLLISTPKITRFFNDCCEKLPLGITHEMLMKHCKINGETPLIDYFAGIDMLKLSVKI